MSDRGDEQAIRLDGNVAAGVLTEVFRGEPSAAYATCSGCGAVAPIGRLLAYGMEMGAILRCPVCDTAVVRIGTPGAALFLDLRGAVSVRFEVRG
jgi:hypothetical protein